MSEFISFVVFAVFAVGAVISYNNTTAKQALLRLNTSKERIMYRKLIFRRRIKILIEVACFPVICLIITWIMFFVYNFLSEERFLDYKIWIGGFFMILAIIIIVVVPVGLFIFMQYKGNLSYYEIDPFLREINTFVLYLISDSSVPRASKPMLP